jgi:xylulokinase
MEYVLAFDVGTTSMKCCAYDENFHIAAEQTAEYALSTPEPGIVEADPEVYWNGLCSGVRAVLAAGIRPEQLRAAAMTTQGETMIALDPSGKPVLPAIVWLDGRADKEAAELERAIGRERFHRTTGLPEFSGALPLAKLKWLLAHVPGGRRVGKVLLLEDYLVWRLTGVFASESSLLCSTGYLNILSRQYDADFLTAAGAAPSLLPEILPPGTIAGCVSAEAARASGLIAGTPVCCTAMDQTASAIGAGNIRPGVVTETTGTCLTVTATAREPNFDLPVPLQYYTHFDGQYLALSFSPTAAMILKWFKDRFLADSADARASGQNIYEYMSSLAAAVPAGCGGLLLLPHFAGKAMPRSVPGMRGAFWGLGLDTTRGSMIRAVMEGVAFSLREHLDSFQAAGIPVSEIRALGGGAKDELWCEIKACAAGRPIQLTESQETTSLGAAILAAHALGDGSVEELCSRAVRLERRFVPDAALQTQYDRFYQNYLRLDRLASEYYSDAADK